MNPPVPAPETSRSAAGRPAPDAAVLSLTEGLVHGQDEAFATLHASYHGRLRRYLLVVCRGDEQAAGEALQDTWIRVARHARRFGDEADLWRWLAALARSAAVDGSRRHTRYRAALERYLAWFRGQFAAGGDEDREAIEPLDRLETLLELGLRELGDEDRELLVDRYRRGRPVREIAAALGVTEKALESRLFRLRACLRRQLLNRLAIDHENPPT